MKNHLSFLVILFLLFSLQTNAQTIPDFKKIDAYFEQMVKEWGVPGASIGIVKDGELVFTGNYGIKEVGRNEKPDSNTLYAIASNSKAFTTAVIGMLVQEGDKLRLLFSNSPRLNATLKHWHHDTFEIIWDEKHAWFNFGTLKFNTDNNMKVISMDFEVPNDDIFFEELKPMKVR